MPKPSIQNLSILDGPIENLQYTTQISGGGESSTRTTHIALFNLANHRIMLKSPQPPMIQNGDQVIVAGGSQPGQFTALACRNISTGWMTQTQNQGCAIAICAVMLAFSGLFCLVMPLALPMPIFLGYLIYKMNKWSSLTRQAHSMIAYTPVTKIPPLPTS
ncbi:hypothetical protein Rhal01_03164 [Rubritalea halochordaticola]|uniref:Uncharacterized protein n=1 Tax=Rubritalea halochordaticola TaxID=714537 RepID=A0ABP9V2T3_9BACT